MKRWCAFQLLQALPFQFEVVLFGVVGLLQGRRDSVMAEYDDKTVTTWSSALRQAQLSLSRRSTQGAEIRPIPGQQEQSKFLKTTYTSSIGSINELAPDWVDGVMNSWNSLPWMKLGTKLEICLARLCMLRLQRHPFYMNHMFITGVFHVCCCPQLRRTIWACICT